MFVHQQPSQVQLYRMSQLADATSLDDDWTGLNDADARRKRQNRLNVRAYRRRKTQAVKAAKAKSNHIFTSDTQTSCWIESRQIVMKMPDSASNSFRDPRLPLLPMEADARAALSQVIFPLSSDHLIPLLQYNVLRGCLANRELVSRVLSSESQDYEPPPTDLHVFPCLETSAVRLLPSSLYPTRLQSSVAHEHWIDIIPHPVLRDNLIQASGRFDADELWSDTVGGLFEGFPDSEAQQRGVIMWDPPWHFSGWELSEGFVHRWTWSLKGCDDLLETTNWWRKKRGEEPIALNA